MDNLGYAFIYGSVQSIHPIYLCQGVKQRYFFPSKVEVFSISMHNLGYIFIYFSVQSIHPIYLCQGVMQPYFFATKVNERAGSFHIICCTVIK